jgi:hypothetical protein
MIMPEQYPSRQEIEFALNNLQRNQHELDVHERLILRNFRKMANDEQKQILSYLLERVQHYNNTLVAGGYAAFFAAWTFFRNQYEGVYYDASLLIMLFSVMIFVLWNVFSNIVMSNDLFNKAEIVSRNVHDPMYLYEALASFDSGNLATDDAP